MCWIVSISYPQARNYMLERSTGLAMSNYPAAPIREVCAPTTRIALRGLTVRTHGIPGRCDTGIRKRAEVDAQLISAAAVRSAQLWPEDIGY